MNYSEILEQEITEIRKIPVKRIEEIVAYIHSNLGENARIITSGMGKAGQIAHTFATTLSSTGTASFFLHPSEAQHGDLGMMKAGDMVVLFTNSGKTREVHELVDLIHYGFKQNKIIAIVGQSNAELEAKCTEILQFGPINEVCPLGLTPTTSTTCMSIICDLIVVGLMEKNNFTKEQYSKFHHGGYLGQKSKS